MHLVVFSRIMDICVEILDISIVHGTVLWVQFVTNAKSNLRPLVIEDRLTLYDDCGSRK